MNIAGIVAEYDPFHKGHAYHIAATREAGATHIVAVISGAFTQRGEPAMLTKWQRAAMALSAGADLVVENPLPWAMAPAERFAEGGIAILGSLGCVDMLSFGSECGDTEALSALATHLDSPEHRQQLRECLSTGLSYAAARQAAVEARLGQKSAALLAGANNTLGLEYIRAIRRQGVAMSPFTVPRKGAEHNATEAAETASASFLRQCIREDALTKALAYVPANAGEILKTALAQGQAPADSTNLENAILAKLRSMSTQEIGELPYLSEGLENRLYQASRTAQTLEELMAAVRTKRYPAARLRRILWAALLGLPRRLSYRTPPYIRLLGFNVRGEEILAAARPHLPIVSNARQISRLPDSAQKLFQLECRASDLHALLMPNPLPCGTDLTTKIVRV